MDRWCEEAGGDITRNDLVRGERETATLTDDSNFYWVALENAAKNAFVSFLYILTCLHR